MLSLMHPDGVLALWLRQYTWLQKTVHLVDLLFLNAHCLQLPTTRIMSSTKVSTEWFCLHQLVWVVLVLYFAHEDVSIGWGHFHTHSMKCLIHVFARLFSLVPSSAGSKSLCSAFYEWSWECGSCVDILYIWTFDKTWGLQLIYVIRHMKTLVAQLAHSCVSCICEWAFVRVNKWRLADIVDWRSRQQLT